MGHAIQGTMQGKLLFVDERKSPHGSGGFGTKRPRSTRRTTLWWSARTMPLIPAPPEGEDSILSSQAKSTDCRIRYAFPMSAYATKRACALTHQTSAYDPNRTLEIFVSRRPL
jgi:hypothetical protein